MGVPVSRRKSLPDQMGRKETWGLALVAIFGSRPYQAQIGKWMCISEVYACRSIVVVACLDYVERQASQIPLIMPALEQKHRRTS